MPKQIKQVSKIPFKVKPIIGDLIMKYCLSFGDLIKNKNLLNIRKFLFKLDFSIYENNRELYETLLYSKIALRGRLKYKITKNELLRIYLREEIGNNIQEDIFIKADSMENMETEEVKYVDNFINTNLRSANIQENKDELIQILDAFDIGQYDNKTALMNLFFDKIKGMLNYERRIALQANYEREVDFGSKELTQQLSDIIEEAHNPKRYIYSGLKWLNEMVGGAFEAGRCYMFLGPPKSFKSGLLLTLVLWFRKFNPHIEASDPRKKPYIIYLTQENSVQETIERIYAMETNSNLRFKDLTKKNIIEGLTDGVNFTIKDSNIGLKIMYRPSGSITTDDIYTIIEDAEDEGKEVICFCHDHIKKMRPRIGLTRSERHIELGSISEDFCTIAKVKNLVFLATAHMNRNSLNAIETMKSAGKTGFVKALRTSDIGESLQMSENCDISIVVEREFYANMQYVQGFKLLHTRVTYPEHDMFYVPFAPNEYKEGSNNTIRLLEDFGTDKIVSFTEEDAGQTFIDQSFDKVVTRINSYNQVPRNNSLMDRVNNTTSMNKKRNKQSKEPIDITNDTNDILNLDED